MFAKVLFNRQKSSSDAGLSSLISPPIKEELLQVAKREKKLKWNPSFITLTLEKLDLFKKDKKSLITTFLIKNVMVGKSMEKPFCLAISSTPENIYLVSFEDENSLNSWFKVLNETIESSKELNNSRSNSFSQTTSLGPNTPKEEVKQLPPPVPPKEVQKKKIGEIKKTKLTPEQEFEIFLSALQIFQKEPNLRTMEENAYVVALFHYQHELKKHINVLYNRGTNCKPEFSLSTGTYILCKEDEFRTEEEREFLDEMIKLSEKMKQEKLKEDEIAFEFNEISKNLRDKKKLQKDEQYFMKKMKKIKREIKVIEKVHGVKVSHSLLSHSLTFAKYEDELSVNDVEFLMDIQNCK
jgi:hypothetical protein